MERFCVGVEPAVQCGWSILWHPIGENWFFHCQFVSSLDSILVRDGSQSPASCLSARTASARLCAGPAHAATVSVSPHGRRQYCFVWKTLFPWSHPLPLTLSASSSTEILTPEVRGLMTTSHLEPRAPKSLTLAHCSVIGLCVASLRSFSKLDWVRHWSIGVKGCVRSHFIDLFL